MANGIIDFIKRNETVKKFINGEKIEYVTDDVIGTAFLVAAKYLEKKSKMIIVTSNLYNSQRVYELLTTLVSEDECLFFPVDELLRTDLIAESKEIYLLAILITNLILPRIIFSLADSSSSSCHFLNNSRFVSLVKALQLLYIIFVSSDNHQDLPVVSPT